MVANGRTALRPCESSSQVAVPVRGKVFADVARGHVHRDVHVGTQILVSRHECVEYQSEPQVAVESVWITGPGSPESGPVSHSPEHPQPGLHAAGHPATPHAPQTKNTQALQAGRGWG